VSLAMSVQALFSFRPGVETEPIYHLSVSTHRELGMNGQDFLLCA
jgi:hypothetical protein